LRPGGGAAGQMRGKKEGLVTQQEGRAARLPEPTPRLQHNATPWPWAQPQLQPHAHARAPHLLPLLHRLSRQVDPELIDEGRGHRLHADGGLAHGAGAARAPRKVVRLGRLLRRAMDGAVGVRVSGSQGPRCRWGPGSSTGGEWRGHRERGHPAGACWAGWGDREERLYVEEGRGGRAIPGPLEQTGRCATPAPRTPPCTVRATLTSSRGYYYPMLRSNLPA